MPTLIGEVRDGDGTLSVGSGGQPQYAESRNYLVQADFIGQSRFEILTQTPGLPRPGISQAGFALCKNVTATRRTEQGLIWEVSADFDSEVEEGQDENNQGGGNPNPQAWIPEYETKFERKQEASVEDRVGKVYANSLGDPFETGLMLTRFIPVWEFYQFESASITDEQIMDRNETVNNATFKGKAEKTLLLTVQSTIGRYYGRRLRLNFYTIKYDKKTWTAKRLDVGPRYGPAPGISPFEQDGVPYIGALDGSGGKQADGTAPATVEFDEYEPIDFKAFLRI